MSKIVANLDAAIEAYKAEQGEVDRALRLFGRDWTLLPDISTAALNPILQVQAMAEEAKTKDQQDAVGLRALSAIQETIVGTVVPEEREALRYELDHTGFPLNALEIIMEQVMAVFTAVPLEDTATPIQESPAESTSDYLSLPTPSGETLKPVSTPVSPVAPSLVTREGGPELKATTKERWVVAE